MEKVTLEDVYDRLFIVMIAIGLVLGSVWGFAISIMITFINGGRE
jgi:hypothetical protein